MPIDQGGPAVASCIAGEGELSAAPVCNLFFSTTATFVASSIPGTGIEPIAPNEVEITSTNG